MRKRKYLIGLASGLVLSVAVAGVAKADLVYNSQSLVVTPSSGAQDKKTPGPLNSFFTDVITDYTNTGAGPPDKYAVRTRVYFPKDFVFNVKGLGTCEPTPAFTSGTTANAVATCPQAVVSTEDHTNTNKATLKVGGLPDVPAVVTAFNGTPDPSGLPRILLHSQTPAANRTLIGTLKPSDVAGFGKMLDVPVDLGPFQAGAAISDFRVTIGKVKLPKGKAASAAKKKKKKAQQYYIMAKCSKKTWNFQAVTDYHTGAAPGTPAGNSTATTSSKCKQKKAKKKK